MNLDGVRTALLKGHEFMNKGLIEKLKMAEKLPVVGDLVTPLMMARNVISAGAHFMHGDVKGGAYELGAGALRGGAEFADVGALLTTAGVGDILTEGMVRPAMTTLANKLENRADARLPKVVADYQAMKRSPMAQSGKDAEAAPGHSWALAA